MTREPTIKIKLPIYKDESKFDLFDTNSHSIYPNENGDTPDALVQKGANVWTVITSGGIWFANGKFGVTWKLNQAIVKPPDTFEKGKCYIPIEKNPDAYDSDGETEAPKSAPLEIKVDSLQTPSPSPEPAEPTPEPAAEPAAEPVVEAKETKETKKKTSKKA
jgi:hypothetical protein